MDKRKQYTVEHIGYPVAGRPIRDEEWKIYSQHATLSAARKRIVKAVDHLSQGTWDDHYRIKYPDGTYWTYAGYPLYR